MTLFLEAGMRYYVHIVCHIFIAAICLLPTGAMAQQSAVKPSFDKYHMVQTRNVFDPDRRAMARPQAGPQNTGGAASSKPVTRGDYVALTGIMVTEGRSLAFFSGSRTEYDKVLEVKGSVAGATVTKITPTNIEVQRDGKTITVAVGQTVPFDDSEPAAAPAPVAPALDPETVSATVPLPSTISSPSNPSSNPTAPGTSDVLRRMMERRQRELQ